MENVKLIVCDLDGTLLNSKKEVSARTASVLKRAKQEGFRICYASGRYEPMMSVYADAIGGCDYMISCNGALARCVSEKKALYHSLIPKAGAVAIQEYLIGERMDFTMYTVDGVCYSAYSPKLAERMESYEKLSARLGHPVELGARAVETAQHFDDVTKIVAYEDDEARLKQYIAWVTKHMPELYCESTGYGLMGTFNQAASKQTAVESIKAHMGIGPERVYVFGDFDNDLSMFACADNRIAMGNAVQELKDAATCVTKSNDEDGVAVYVENLLNNKR